MSRIAKTEQTFKEELNNKNPFIKVLGEYKNSCTKIEVQCKECEHKWKALPSNLLSGSGCPVCGKESFKEKKRLSEDIFLQRVKELRPDIEVEEKYKNNRQKIKCYCKKCKKSFIIQAQSLINTKKIMYGCENCREDKRLSTRINLIDVKNRLKKINPFIEIIDKKKDLTTRDKVKIKCKKCGHEWYASLNNLLNKHTGCPQCRESKGERKIRIFLEKNNIKFISQYKFKDCKDKKYLPFDFYLPKYNLCIEYDGILHFSPANYLGGEEKLKYTQKHDKIKTEYCKNKNINLLRIDYKQYKNIENILKKELKVGDA